MQIDADVKALKTQITETRAENKTSGEIGADTGRHRRGDEGKT